MQKDDKAFRWGVILLDALLIIGLLAAAIIANRANRQGEDTPRPVSASQPPEGVLRQTVQTQPIQPPEEPKENSEAEDPNRLAPGSFQVTMTTTWNFPDAESAAEDSYVENAVNNAYDIRFRIVLAEEEDTELYVSPLLPVGSYTAGIRLQKELEPGTYPCVAVYTLYTPGTEEEAGKVRVALSCIVGE